MQEEYIIRILLAGLAGGLIGLERAYHDKSAGFRTMILIATGSAFFTIISDVMGDPIRDNARIAAAVVSGVGFLGAGVIIKDGMSIRGLTTAASIWLVASLGMGMGLGLYQLVWVVTGSILVVLWFLPPFERWVDGLHEFLTIRITIKNTDKQEEKVLKLFADSNVRVVHVRRSQDKTGERVLHIMAKTTPAKRATIGKALANNKSVLRFDA
tara:strand:- start:603 stop:1238 length:636 start_codon:yes stop_codon:yes gene_type:complete